MIEFELQNIRGGWGYTFTPDNISFILKTENTDHRMTSSLKELLEWYGYLYNEETGSFFVGADDRIGIKERFDYESLAAINENEDFIVIEKYPLQILTSYTESRQELGEFLADVFEELDSMESKTPPDEHLDFVQEKLDEDPHDIDYDVHELYFILTA